MKKELMVNHVSADGEINTRLVEGELPVFKGQRVTKRQLIDALLRWGAAKLGDLHISKRPDLLSNKRRYWVVKYPDGGYNSFDSLEFAAQEALRYYYRTNPIASRNTEICRRCRVHLKKVRDYARATTAGLADTPAAKRGKLSFGDWLRFARAVRAIGWEIYACLYCCRRRGALTAQAHETYGSMYTRALRMYRPV